MPTEVLVPALGESVKNAVILKWHKKSGEAVKVDEPLCELETDKANVDVPAPVAGVLTIARKEGETVDVGAPLASIDPSGAASAASASQGAAKSSAGAASRPATPAVAVAPHENRATAGIPSAAASSSSDAQGPVAGKKPEDVSPAVRRIVAEGNLDAGAIKGTGPGGRITKEDAQAYAGGGNGATASSTSSASAPSSTQQTATQPASQPPASQGAASQGALGEGQRRVAMTKIRRRIAETLVRAQHTAAMLTTSNEIDMTAVMELRAKYKEKFQETHGVGLGFMSFFARACVAGLKELPAVNAFIDGADIIYNDNVHLGIAVSTDRGLAVPVLRNVQGMSLARIESEIKRLATATRDGKLSLDELQGGTFTVTNGGIYGSLFSTPIINPPQSAILGMHAIQQRPVAVNGAVVVRPMMYVALSYDHRMVDGKEAVTFLVRIKQLIEDPSRLLLEI